jgi:hypothetical protein
MTDVAIENRVVRRWVHVDFLMHLTMKKSIFHVKLRDSPLTNIGHRNKSMNGGPVSNTSKKSPHSHDRIVAENHGQ